MAKGYNVEIISATSNSKYKNNSKWSYYEEDGLKSTLHLFTI